MEIRGRNQIKQGSVTPDKLLPDIGIYDKNKQYPQGSTVLFNGSVYIALEDIPESDDYSLAPGISDKWKNVTGDYAQKDLTNVENSVFLEKIKTVDGPDSGIDADTVDGLHADSFSLAGHTHTIDEITNINEAYVAHADQADHSLSSDQALMSEDSDNLGGLPATDYQLKSEKNQPGGYAGVDDSGKIPNDLLPSIAISEVYVVNTIEDRDNLTVETGDICIVTDTDGNGTRISYVFDGTQWIQLDSGAGVSSVDGQTGDVDLSSVYAPYTHTHPEFYEQRDTLSYKMVTDGGLVYEGGDDTITYNKVIYTIPVDFTDKAFFFNYIESYPIFRGSNQYCVNVIRPIDKIEIYDNGELKRTVFSPQEVYFPDENFRYWIPVGDNWIFPGHELKIVIYYKDQQSCINLVYLNQDNAHWDTKITAAYNDSELVQSYTGASIRFFANDKVMVFLLRDEGYAIADTKADVDLANVDNTVFLEKIKAVDGPDSGIDADTLDGLHASDISLTDHTHVRDDITDFWSEPFWESIPDKPTEFTPVNHTHTISEIIDISDASVAYATNAGDADTLDGKDSTDFAEANHTHTISEITNISDASVSYATNSGDSDTVDGHHAEDFMLISTYDSDADGQVEKADLADNSVLLDGKTLQEVVNHDVNYIQIRTDIDTEGWYTIAVAKPSIVRAIAKFAIIDKSSGRHQTVIFYVTQLFSRLSNISVVAYSTYGYTEGNIPFAKLRVKAYNTYAGAVLQAYIYPGYEDLKFYILTDNLQENGWELVNALPDDTAPDSIDPDEYALFINRAFIDFGTRVTQNIFNKNLYVHDTDNIYKVWHEANDGPGSGLNADTVDGYEAEAFALAGHTHTRSEITDFWAEPFWNNIPDKPTEFTPASHIHTISEITDISNASVAYATNASDSDTVDGYHAADFAQAGHTHTISDITDISDASVAYAVNAGNADTLDGKDSTDFAEAGHTHVRSNVTDFWATPFWDNIPDKPSTYTPAAHTHTIADITDISDASVAYAANAGELAGHTVSDLDIRYSDRYIIEVPETDGPFYKTIGRHIDTADSWKVGRGQIILQIARLGGTTPYYEIQYLRVRIINGVLQIIDSFYSRKFIDKIRLITYNNYNYIQVYCSDYFGYQIIVENVFTRYDYIYDETEIDEADLVVNMEAVVPDNVMFGKKELIDTLQIGNSAGLIPINNGILNETLNADLLDGKDSSDFINIIDLTGQLQKASYRKSVIALADMDNTDINAYSFSNGKIVLNRSNGITNPSTVEVSIQKIYNSTNAKGTIIQHDGAYAKLCTFTYDGKKYAGIEYYQSNAENGEIYFAGITNFGIFGLDYYDVENDVALIQEVADSLAYDVTDVTELTVSGTNKVWHSGNDGPDSGLDADTVDGLHASSFSVVGHTHTISDVTDISDAHVAYADQAGSVDLSGSNIIHVNEIVGNFDGSQPNGFTVGKLKAYWRGIYKISFNDYGGSYNAAYYLNPHVIMFSVTAGDPPTIRLYHNEFYTNYPLIHKIGIAGNADGEYYIYVLRDDTTIIDSINVSVFSGGYAFREFELLDVDYDLTLLTENVTELDTTSFIFGGKKIATIDDTAQTGTIYATDFVAQ